MTERAPPIIALRNVVKRYGGKEVLAISELELRQGEAVLVWGSNASGKSTLLRVLAGIASPTKGTRRLDPAYRTAPRVFLPQTGGLYEDLTIWQNLLILSRLHNRSPDQTPFAALLDDDGASRDLNKAVGSLSGGMQRIVSIAAMLSLRPELLFLDEPFGSLDTSHRKRLRDILGKVGASIPLLVMTEHRPDCIGKDWRMIGVVDGRIQGAP